MLADILMPTFSQNIALEKELHWALWKSIYRNVFTIAPNIL